MSGLTGVVVIVVAAAGAGLSAQTPQGTVVPSPPPAPILIAPPPPPPPPVYQERYPRDASPVGNPGNWMTNMDYPPQALREQQEGVSYFRIKVDPQGRPSACEIIQSSNWPLLDQAACSVVMRRARFFPALDKKGRAVKGTWASRIRWVIPKPEDPISIFPNSRSHTLIIETDGTPTHCQSFLNGQQAPELSTPSPCSAGQKFTPILDEKGNPVRKRVTITTKVEVTDPGPD